LNGSDKGDAPGSPASIRSHAMSLNFSSAPTTADIAFTALQYLPIPILVLNSLKTTVFANESFGKLIAEETQVNSTDCRRLSENILGQTLGQIGKCYRDCYSVGMVFGLIISPGVDLLQNGVPFWVSWEVSANRSNLNVILGH